MMFRFRLERVLQHRQRQVDTCSREVASAQHAVQGAETTVADALTQLQRYRAESAARRQGILDPTSLQQLTSWQDELVARRNAAESALQQCRRSLEAAQGELKQAWRDREVLERLRQRQRQEWEQEQARRERRALDEIGAIRSALAGRYKGETTKASLTGGE